MAGMMSQAPDNVKKTANPANLFKKGGVTAFGDPLEFFKKPEEDAEAKAAAEALLAEARKPATVMPMPDDEAIKASRRRSTAAQRRRSGRQSTILTNPDGDTLG